MADRARGVELRALSPEDTGRAAAARGVLAEARRAAPTIDQGRRALARLSGHAGRQLAVRYHEDGYEHTALTLAHNSLRGELGQERREALATLAGLSEPQLQHVLLQPPPLAQNAVSERLADLQRADGPLAALPAEPELRRSTFSAAAPMPATAELRDAPGRSEQPTPSRANKPAGPRSARGSGGARPWVAAPASSSAASPPSEPPPPPRPQNAGER